MHILVTRPEPFANETTQILRDQGYVVTQAPLLNVVYHPLPENDEEIEACDALVVTSRHALLTPGLERFAHLPLWCVGTNEKLLQHGWVGHAFPDVQTLIQHMPTSSHWLYVRGKLITQPLLRHHIVEHVGYTATHVKQWPVDIDWQTIDAVMLMSQETARTFMRITKPDSVSHITALCYSQSICDVVSRWSFCRAIACSNPALIKF